MQLTSRIFKAEDLEAAAEFCYQQKWTDGLPVIPPTRGAIEHIIAYLQRHANEVIGVVVPRNGIATIEKIAINCVMAGCKPQYILTTGGWGSGAGFCCVCAGWGALGGLSVSKRVTFPGH
jgi:hypothetical protein